MKIFQDISFLQVWGIFALMLFGRFILFAFGSYLIFYPSKKASVVSKKIQKKFPSKKRIIEEIKQSFFNLLLLCVLSSIVIYEIKNGVGGIYYSISDYGIIYFGLSIVIMMLLHDTWFYWIHRIMHNPKLYKYLHKVHHKSVNPTPFSSFSMDWTEMILEFGIFPILILVVPLHPLAFSIFVFIAFLFNIMGHLGYEILPKKWVESKIGQLINTSTKHNQHHEKFHFNYGYYFTFWDRVMKTEYKSIIK